MLPATTFLENYDIAKGYGPISLQLVRPVIEPVGEARPNAEVFSDLAERLGVGDAEEETDTLMRVLSKLPPRFRRELSASGIAAPPYGGAPVQFVDVFPLTPDRKVNLFPRAARPRARRPACTATSRTRRPRSIPLALISPASEKTVSSTLGELRERAAVLQMNPADARGARARDRRSGARVQRARRGAVPGRAEPGHPPRHRLRCRRACGARAPTTA